MSEYPFLLTPNTLPVPITSNGVTAGVQQLWPTPGTNQPIGVRQIIVQNPSGNPTFYVTVGSVNTIAATSSNHQIYAGTIQTFTVVEQNNYFSALSASGSATLSVTPGSGE